MNKNHYLSILFLMLTYTLPVYSADPVPFNVVIESNNVSSYPAICDIDILKISDDINYDQPRCFLRFKSATCIGEKIGECTANSVISIDAANARDANLSPDKNVKGKCFPANQALNLTTKDSSYIKTKESGLFCITSDEAYAKFNGSVVKYVEGSGKDENKGISQGAKVESNIMLRRGTAGNVIGAKFGYKF